MKVPFLDLNRQHEPIKNELDAAYHEVMAQSNFIGGKVVEEFENAFANYIGVNQCVTCGSGTDALELILQAFDIGHGDEVIIPSFTWVSDAEAVIAVGAKPVYADITEDYSISLEDIKRKITSKTKAIIAVHLYGNVCDMNGLMEFANQHKIKIIEDCAQAHGAVYNGKKVGAIGHAAAFSFYPTKNLGALGDGGAITTNDEDFAAKLRLIKDHGQSKRDVHEAIGRNSRLDTLQAAFLLVKLKKLDEYNKQRREISEKYIDGLKDLRLTLPVLQAGRVYHLFVIQLTKSDELKQYLESKGITTAVHYPNSIHSISVYNDNSLLPTAEKAAKEVLSLPLYVGMKDEEIEYVIRNIREFYQ